MSLDVYLDYPTTIHSDPPAHDIEIVYEANITHNLGKMASEAGIYKHLWRPDEIGITKAKQLIDPLRKGLSLLRSDRDRFEAHNPPNGWQWPDETPTRVNMLEEDMRRVLAGEPSIEDEQAARRALANESPAQ